ncbi:serine protease inhibitor A6-like [Dendrobates tinctorius]|uniref:serine protease inhibitor A6-like n=1 Tax=Dendrobates tinctorius TaxID=92724 RepID=UPI003CCA2794
MQLLRLLLFSVSMTIASQHGRQTGDDSLSKASMQFAISLFKFVSSKTAKSPANIFICPPSIYTSTALLALGARSSTRQQILDAMFLNSTQTNKTLKDDFKDFLTKIRLEKEGAQFRLSNWFFLDNSRKPQIQYQQDLAEYYNATIQSVDFKDPEKAAQNINEQVSCRTDGKIEDLVHDLDTQTAMVLLDYASFEAKWENPFYQVTKQRSFQVNKIKSPTVPMIHRVGQYRTFKDKALGCVMVEVPYNEHLVLLLIMPNKGYFDLLQVKLSPKLIEYYISEARTSLLDLYIPEIMIEHQINVQDALLHMGVTQAFSDNADFSRISEEPGLKVSTMYQRILIKIAENGTDSSGAQVIQGITLPKDFELTFDRSFLALIYCKHMKTVLILGRVMDPSQV